MAMYDAYSAHDTTERISAIGVKKAIQRIDHMIIKAFLAGVLLSFGGLFLLTVGGGSAPVAQSLGPGIHKMILAAVFPIGLVLVVITGADLFTGNTMVLTVSTLHRKTTWFNLIISWVVSFFGNLVGCLFFQYILVYYAGLLSNDPYRSFTVKYAETKGNTEWHQMFLRGIGGNWLVCLALWLGANARDLNSKIIGIYLPIWLFVAVGYEHSIANMFTVQMGMTLGADLSVGKYILRVLLPVTIGNILGGGFFVGFLYWYLYLAKAADTDAGTEAGPPVNNAYQTVRQYEEVVQAQ
jgi:formate/nitrite transporter